MPVEFRTVLPNKEEFWAFFISTGWNSEYRLSQQDLIAAMANSWYTISAYSKGTLVGFGRVVTDGIMHAMIYELIVSPEFQHQAIGTRILDTLVNKCLEANIHDIQLFCASGKQSFYEKRGFRVRPSNAPGMDYRKDRNQ